MGTMNISLPDSMREFVDKQVSAHSYGTTSEYVHLVSSSGLEVDMRVFRPDYDGRRKLPVLLMLGGYRTGKDAVDLVGDPQGIAYAAIDYPYHGEQALSRFAGSVAAIPAVQRAFLDSPPAVLMALNWLLEQPWADEQRIELAGVDVGARRDGAGRGALEAGFAKYVARRFKNRLLGHCRIAGAPALFSLYRHNSSITMVSSSVAGTFVSVATTPAAANTPPTASGDWASTRTVVPERVISRSPVSSAAKAPAQSDASTATAVLPPMMSPSDPAATTRPCDIKTSRSACSASSM